MTAFATQLPIRADLLLALFSKTLEPQVEGKGSNAKPSAFSGLLDQLVESADPAAPCPQGTLPGTHADPGSTSCGLAASPACPSTGAAKTSGVSGHTLETVQAASAESAIANSQSRSGQASEIKAAAASAVPARAKTKAAPANRQPAAGDESRPNPSAGLSTPVPDLTAALAAHRHLTTLDTQAENPPLTGREGTADHAEEASLAGNLPVATAVPEVYGVDQTANQPADSVGQAGQTSHVSQAAHARRVAAETLASAPRVPSDGNSSFADNLAQVGVPVPDTGDNVRDDAGGVTVPSPLESVSPARQPNRAVGQSAAAAPAPQPPRREAQPGLTTHGQNVQADRQSASARTGADAAPPTALVTASSSSSGPRAESSSGVPPLPGDAIASPVATSPASSSPASSLAFSARLTPLSTDTNGKASAGYQAQAAGTVALKGRGAEAQRPVTSRAAAPAIASGRDEADDSMPAFVSRTAPADPDADASAGDGASQNQASTPKIQLAADGGNRETNPLAARTPAAPVPAAPLSGSEDPSPAGTSRQPATAANQPAAQTGRGDTSSALTERSHRPVTNTADTPENPAAQTAASWSAAPPERTAEETPPARPAASLPQPPPTVEQPPVSQPKPSGAAQGIQIQMNAGDSRVEVRVTDRGGEVRVDVHTPDSRLAGALRAGLPELAARIEQTGYRAEAWQPLSPSSPDRWRVAESSAASPNTEDRSPRQGEQKQDEGRRQNPQEEDSPAQRKQDRKDFQWLFNSIR